MLEASPEVDPVAFNVNIIKDYMEKNNGNFLYFLKNPYETRFSINDLAGILDHEIYGMINLKGEEVNLTTKNDAFDALRGFIKSCESILIRNDTLQAYNNEILTQNQKVLEKILKIEEKMLKIEDSIDKVLQITKANQENLSQAQSSIHDRDVHGGAAAADF
jgi:hypothetical protein